MQSANQNIVSLSEFKKAREPFEIKDVEEFVSYQQIQLRDLDQVIADHLLDKRLLRDTEQLRSVLAKINGRILEASDWLDDELIITTDADKQAKIEKVRKAAGQLASRSEVTRKVLVDDMANSRYYEQRWLIDPAKFVALVVMAPVGITNSIERFITSKDHIGLHVGEGTVVVGLYLTFKGHADKMLGIAYQKMKHAPAKVRTLAMASAIEIAVRTKPMGEISSYHPKQRSGYEQAAKALKL